MLPLISLCSVNMGRGLKFHRDCSPRQQDDVLVACFQFLPIAFKLQIRQKENNLCKQKGEKKGGGEGKDEYFRTLPPKHPFKATKIYNYCA